MKERVKILIEKRGGNASKFAREIGMSPSAVQAILHSDDKGVTVNLLHGLCKTGVSINWVLEGQGDMYFQEYSQEQYEKLQHTIEVLGNLIKK